MPEQMPEDFNFSIHYGIGKKNVIDTFESIVVKDLIENGTAEVKISFTDEEMSDIYDKMEEINVLGKKKFTSQCESEPYEETEWTIMLNGERVTHYIKEYCDPTKDAEQFLSLRNYVVDKIENKEAYKNLPNAKGGYD